MTNYVVKQSKNVRVSLIVMIQMKTCQLFKKFINLNKKKAKLKFLDSKIKTHIKMFTNAI